MALFQLALAGDSITAGWLLSHSTELGGQGSWAQQVAERLASVSGIGPLVSSGFRGVTLAQSLGAAEWSQSGSWTPVVSTDAFDKGLYGSGVQRSSAGTTAVRTYNKPARWRTTVGFALYYVDTPSTGNWQYRVDGGTWTNMGQTLAHDNAIHKFYVGTPVTSTVDVRAYDGTGNVEVLPLGIELFYASPTSTQGLIVHDLGVSGLKLHDLTAVTSGDRMAWFDTVTLGTGAVSNTPNATVMMHVTDTFRGNTTEYATDLTTFYNRVHPLGTVLFMNPYEIQPEAASGSAPAATQAAYRAQLKTSAAGFGVQVFDLFDQWSSNGWTNNVTAIAAGLIGDGIHESQFGHTDIARRVYPWLRAQLWPTTLNPSVVPYAAAQGKTVGGVQVGRFYSRQAIADGFNNGTLKASNEAPSPVRAPSYAPAAVTPLSPIARVASQDTDAANGVSGSTSFQIIFPANPTAGDLLVIAASSNSAPGGVTATGWTVVADMPFNSGSNSIVILAKRSVGSADKTVTILTPGAGVCQAIAAEYANANVARDGTPAGTQGASATSGPTPSLALASSLSLIITAGGTTSDNGGGSGWANATNIIGDGTSRRVIFGERIPGAAGTYGDIASWTSTHAWGTAIVGFFHA